ncbi:MAG: transporter substrate-binding domain-containing protein [Oceanospirillaceae bacterium]
MPNIVISVMKIHLLVNHKVFLYSIFLICSLSFKVCNADSNSLKFSTTLKENTLSFKLSKILLEKISEEVKVPIELLYLPANQSALLFSLGKIDAEFSRVSQYQELQPNSIKIVEPVSNVPIHVYSVNKNFTVNGWKSLIPYRILTVGGWLYTKENLTEHKTFEVESPLQAFKLLKAGRADLFVTGLLTATGVFNSKGFDKRNIIRLEPPVHIIQTFTYFKPKHTAIAKAYGDALKMFKKDGTYAKILKQEL